MIVARRAPTCAQIGLLCVIAACTTTPKAPELAGVMAPMMTVAPGTDDRQAVSVIVYERAGQLRVSARITSAVDLRLPRAAVTAALRGDVELTSRAVRRLATPPRVAATDGWCAHVISSAGFVVGSACATPALIVHLPPDPARHAAAASAPVRARSVRFRLPWEPGARLRASGLGQRREWREP